MTRALALLLVALAACGCAASKEVCYCPHREGSTVGLTKAVSSVADCPRKQVRQATGGAAFVLGGQNDSSAVCALRRDSRTCCIPSRRKPLQRIQNYVQEVPEGALRIEKAKRSGHSEVSSSEQEVVRATIPRKASGAECGASGGTKRKACEASMLKVWKSKIAGSPRGLRQTVGGGVAVSAVPQRGASLVAHPLNAQAAVPDSSSNWVAFRMPRHYAEPGSYRPDLSRPLPLRYYRWRIGISTQSRVWRDSVEIVGPAWGRDLSNMPKWLPGAQVYPLCEGWAWPGDSVRARLPLVSSLQWPYWCCVTSETSVESVPGNWVGPFLNNGGQ